GAGARRRGDLPRPHGALRRPARRGTGGARRRHVVRPPGAAARGGRRVVTALYETLREWVINLAYEGVLPLAFQYGFVVNALLCALLIGPVLGGVGTMVVAKRMAFFSQAIGNAAM